MAKPAGPALAEDATRQASSQSALVVAEDDPDDFFLLQRALQKVELEVPIYWAKTGGEALQVVSTLAAGARNVWLVTDVKLPDMTGFELVHAARAGGHTARVGIVMLSGFNRLDLENQAHAWHVDAFFEKPASYDDLVQIARSLRQLMTGR